MSAKLIKDDVEPVEIASGEPVEPLTEPEVEDGPPPFVPDYISEGTAKEIELYGFAVDPRTGQRVGVEALPAGRKP